MTSRSQDQQCCCDVTRRVSNHCDVTMCLWVDVPQACHLPGDLLPHPRMDPGGHPQWQDPKEMFPTQRI